MNEKEYRKQLILQQIQSNRERLTLEVEFLKEANPMTPVLDFARTLVAVWNAVSPKAAALTGGSSAWGKAFGLGLSIVLPGLFRVAGSLFGGKK